MAHQAARGASAAQRAQALRDARAAGADAVELDVLPVGDRLLVAHDLGFVGSDPLALADALAAVAPTDLTVQIDIKATGAARPLGDYLRTAGWAPRTLLTGDPGDVELAGSLAGARRAWTLPSAQVGAHAGWLGAATRGALGRVERAAVAAIENGRTDDVCVDRRFVTRSLASGVHAAGGRLLAWTVDRPGQARRLAGLGVDALITNQPAAVRRAISGPLD